MPIKYKKGKVLNDDEKRDSEVHTVKELFHRPRPENSLDILPARTDLGISQVCLKQSAIHALKNVKSAGLETISFEALKSNVETNTKIFSQLYGKIWDRQRGYFRGLLEGHLVKLPKIGS